MRELFDGKVMVRAKVKRGKDSRRELGQVGDLWNGNNVYRQEWREREFFVELSAPILWNLLERTVDFEKLTLDTVEQVVNS